MRKLIVSILMLVYILASTGTSVDIHYCMDKLVAWSFSHQESKSCNSCGMEKQGANNGCCKDEQKFVKTTIDQKVTGNEFQFFQVPTILPVHNIDFGSGTLASHAVNLPRINAPPPDGRPLIYLANCVFRI